MLRFRDFWSETVGMVRQLSWNGYARMLHAMVNHLGQSFRQVTRCVAAGRDIRRLLHSSAALFAAAGTVLSQDWVETTAPSNNWASVACSASGAILIAAAGGERGTIYVSSNSGATWSETTAPATNWISVASSADGKHLFVAVNGGNIYLSSDAGGTWTPTGAPVNNWTSVACSSDGAKALAVAATSLNPYFAQSGPIYLSKDTGVTWTASSAPIAPWISVASSADGTKLLAVRPFGIGVSTDSGVTWTTTNALGYTCSIACSAAGDRLLLGGADPFHIPFGGALSVSTNCGATWEQPSAYTRGRGAVASSADGIKLLAAGGPVPLGPGQGVIYTSTNGGNSWAETSSPGANWSSVATSADGSKRVAAIYGGGIFMAHSTPGPVLKMRREAQTSVISWVVPPVNYVLQHSFDLTNWMGVPAVPVLNLTNLHYELALPEFSSRTFYRLAGTTP